MAHQREARGSVRRPLLLAAGMAGVGAASHWLAEGASAAAPSSHCPAGGADCPAESSCLLACALSHCPMLQPRPSPAVTS